MNELINQETIQLLQYRIQQEELSSRLYEQMSLYLNDKGYLQFAKLYKKYAEEEMKHSQWSKDYILSFGIKPELQRLDSPECEFDGLPDVINKTLEHEIEISKQCKSLAKFANDNADYLLFDLAMKYCKEQIEEIEKSENLKSLLETFGTEKHTLLLLDSHIGEYFEL